MNLPQVVALTGASGSGKSTVARYLGERVGGAALLPLDAYYRDLSHLPLAAREAVNFDHPDAMDLALYRRHLASLRAGDSIEVPRYDFSRHTRSAGSDHLNTAPVVIAEGVLVCEAELGALVDVLVFVETPLDLCLERRIARDLAERGRTEASVRDFWFTRALPMYESFVLPTRERADVILDGTQDPMALAAEVEQLLFG